MGSWPGASSATHDGVAAVAAVLVAGARGRAPNAEEADVEQRIPPSPCCPSLCRQVTDRKPRRSGRVTGVSHAGASTAVASASTTVPAPCRSPRAGSPPATSTSPTSRRARARSRCASTGSPTPPGPGATCCRRWPTPGFRAVAPFLRGLRADRDPRRRSLPDRRARARRRRACTRRSAAGRRRDHRARLGGDGHLRRRQPRPRALAPGRHHGRAPGRLGGRRLPLLRAAPALLVHVLLPARPGRHGRRDERPRLHRRPLGRLVAGLRRVRGPART